MSRFFSIFGTVVLAAFAYAAYTGWTWARYDEVKDVPKSIRSNPGVYRSVYTRYPHK
jgi:hypothetical protein